MKRMLRHPIEVIRRPLTDEERRYIMIAIAAALISFIPSMIAIGFTWHEASARSNQNRRLVNQNKRLIQQVDVQTDRLARVVMEQSTARIENRRRFAASDEANCIEIEKLKQQVRESTQFDLKETRLTLEQFGIDPDSPRGAGLIERGRVRAEKIQERFAPRHGGCDSLPSQAAQEPSGG